MAKSFTIEINPEILKWARETAGYSKEQTAKRLKITEDDYEKLEKGEKSPTFQQLKTLTKFFNRPMAVFFLPSIPEETLTSLSFRKLPKKRKVKRVIFRLK